MKKKMVIALGILFLSSTMAFAVTGPIPIDESNVLPDGNYYGSVTVTQTSPNCVQITADANQTLLIPLSNFGIQNFGFNYAGDPRCLQVALPTGWKDKSKQNLSEFGKYVEDSYTTGSYRKDPLVLGVCSTCGNLAESDVIVKNANGDTFAMHIADFTYGGSQYGDTSSAFFATTDTTGTSTTTTVQPTTTTITPRIESTLIELQSFTATAYNKAVILKWQTASEIDNAGFNIYRSEAEDGEYTTMNAALIPASGSATQGANYTFTDTNVQNRKTYYYKLEDIDLSGKSTLHGPVSATPRLIYAIGK